MGAERSMYLLIIALGNQIMSRREEDRAYLALIDRHLTELEQRFNALKEVIASMAVTEQSTRNQSELLITMLKAQQALQALRATEFQALNASDDS
jgi:hypothetical protein